MSMLRRDPTKVTPSPQFAATGVLIAGIATIPLTATGLTSSEVGRHYAVYTAISLLASLTFDLRRNLRNLVRADLMAIGSLYFLTLFEFLLPQQQFDTMLRVEEIVPALNACLVGFVGIALGRHVTPGMPRGLSTTLRQEVSIKTLLTLYTICLFGGFFYMLVAVDFDFVLMIHQFMGPRFTQNWSRGKLGDWKALIGELGMVVYLVPPIAGIIFAKRSEFSTGQRAYVALTFLFTLFYGYSSGTRNIFATYLCTFLVAFAFVLRPDRKKELITVGVAVITLMLTATVTMLEFRSIGLERYLAGEVQEEVEVKKEVNFFVDNNVYVIAKLIQVFPDRHDYLGFEIPYLSLIRPIPRALWSGKPEGMSTSIEDSLGAEGLTLASSFVGEAYMSGGLIGVFSTGIVFGMITGWWNQLGRTDNSPFGFLIFASGFFAAVISMRSMFVFTTAMLPTIAALLLGVWLLDKRRTSRPPPPPPGA